MLATVTHEPAVCNPHQNQLIHVSEKHAHTTMKYIPLILNKKVHALDIANVLCEVHSGSTNQLIEKRQIAFLIQLCTYFICS